MSPRVHDVRLARVYDPPGRDDGFRVLVDRLWPRGVRREDAHLDAWLKEVAPSPGLRTWWDHDPERMAEFAVRYRAELADNTAFDELAALAAEHRTLTLLYGARDPRVNHAVVLRDALAERG